MKNAMYKPSEKNKIHRVDSDENWPTSIKEIIQWFPFTSIMEHTANKMKNNNGLIKSLLFFILFAVCSIMEVKGNHSRDR